MAKREFIDVEQVITEIKNMDNNGCITRAVNHVCEDIRMIPTVSEHEIIKPYLKKFEEQRDYLLRLNKQNNPSAEAIALGINWCINTMLDLLKDIEIEDGEK